MILGIEQRAILEGSTLSRQGSVALKELHLERPHPFLSPFPIPAQQFHRDFLDALGISCRYEVVEALHGPHHVDVRWTSRVPELAQPTSPYYCMQFSGYLLAGAFVRPGEI